VNPKLCTWYTPNIHGAKLNQSRSLVTVIVAILSLVLLFGLVWGNYQFAEKNIAGEGFQIQWIGIRSLITNGNSPYSDQVTSQIQETIAFEHSFAQGTPPRYTSPFYSAIVFLPFMIMENRSIAHALWLSAQLVAIFLILILSLKITAWKPPLYIFLIFSLFTIFSYHVIIPWLDGSLAIWAALFVVLAFLAIRNNWNEGGGILLAFSTIQPQMTIVLVVFILLWAISHHKKSLLIWFFMTLIIISIIGLFLVPNWIMQYFRLIYSFSAFFPPGSPSILFRSLWPGLGKQLGWLITGLALIILLVEWWLAMKKEFRWFLWTACLTIVLSQWIGIPTIPGNFIIMVMPLILVSSMLAERWPRGGQWAAALITAILFIWEWALYYYDLTSKTPTMQLNLIIPLPLILIIGLYWIRWWAIKPKRLLIEELRLSETR
jgi:hypothetical protein